MEARALVEEAARVWAALLPAVGPAQVSAAPPRVEEAAQPQARAVEAVVL